MASTKPVNLAALATVALAASAASELPPIDASALTEASMPTPDQAEQAAPVEQPKTAHITPTIGRKLWFWPSGLQCRTGMRADGVQPCDATVIYVHNDGRLNLRVTDHIGQTHPLNDVELVQGIHPAHGADAPEGCATWMPYQAKQAAKA